MLTRERKILLTVAALGLTALTVDRLMLGTSQTGPHTAAASAFAVSPAAAAPTTAQAGLTLRSVQAGPSVAERLVDFARARQLPADGGIRDAFAPDAAWVPPAPAALVKAAEVADLGPSLAERFRGEHRLMAVMLSGGQTVAIVDGRPMRVGQQLDGLTLVHIQQMATLPTGVEPASATFASEAVRVRLTLR